MKNNILWIVIALVVGLVVGYLLHGSGIIPTQQGAAVGTVNVIGGTPTATKTCTPHTAWVNLGTCTYTGTDGKTMTGTSCQSQITYANCTVDKNPARCVHATGLKSDCSSATFTPPPITSTGTSTTTTGTTQLSY